MNPDKKGVRENTGRRKTDRIHREHMSTEVSNPFKLRMFLGGIFTVFTLIVIFAPLWMYLFVIFWLLVDYFVLLGGTLNWLNKKIDDQFKGTGFLRRLLATDARIILATTSISVLVLIADYFYIPTVECSHHLQMQWSDRPLSHSLHMVYSFYYYMELGISQKLTNGVTFALSEIYIFTVLIRGLLIGSLIHVIHHLLINQHLAGVKFTTYPPIMSWIYKLVIWARK